MGQLEHDDGFLGAINQYFVHNAQDILACARIVRLRGPDAGGGMFSVRMASSGSSPMLVAEHGGPISHQCLQ